MKSKSIAQPFRAGLFLLFSASCLLSTAYCYDYGIGLKIGAHKLYNEDYTTTKYCGNYNTGPLWGMEFSYRLQHNTYFLLSLLHTSNTYKDTLGNKYENVYTPIIMNLFYTVQKTSDPFIFVMAGIGTYIYKYEKHDVSQVAFGLNAGAGIEYPILGNVGIILCFRAHYIFNGNSATGVDYREKFNDYSGTIGLSVRSYF